jgi:cytochrome c oxidase assembly protein subunit 15
MDSSVALVDLSPALRLLLGAAAAAAALLGWLAWRQRRSDARARLAALTALALFLTFDLIVFGSFTRLTDSGLGCPDWPGCYGAASPVGAKQEIAAAEAAMPTGPVTVSKAWIEMIHRYLAMTVGALILVLAVASWILRRQLPHSAWWPSLTLIWVIVQGLFGKYTVTLKLYPAIVSLHLLGGMLLLALLVLQFERWRARPLTLDPAIRRVAVLATAALWLQIALGGWVSTNYAVLACRGFPDCNGQWWPSMELAQGFALLRPLGATADGGLLSFEALVGIHFVHRLWALAAMGLLLLLGWRLWRAAEPTLRRTGLFVGALALAQLFSGLSNVVLDWPLAAALAHSAGAAALVGVTTSLLARARIPRSATHRAAPAPGAHPAA